VVVVVVVVVEEVVDVDVVVEEVGATVEVGADVKDDVVVESAVELDDVVVATVSPPPHAPTTRPNTSTMLACAERIGHPGGQLTAVIRFAPTRTGP